MIESKIKTQKQKQETQAEIYYLLKFLIPVLFAMYRLLVRNQFLSRIYIRKEKLTLDLNDTIRKYSITS